jgi:hypothetical protein
MLLLKGRHVHEIGSTPKRQDNIRVLRVRVEKLNGNLHHYFHPQPEKWGPVLAAA